MNTEKCWNDTCIGSHIVISTSKQRFFPRRAAALGLSPPDPSARGTPGMPEGLAAGPGAWKAPLMGPSEGCRGWRRPGEFRCASWVGRPPAERAVPCFRLRRPTRAERACGRSKFARKCIGRTVHTHSSRSGPDLNRNIFSRNWPSLTLWSLLKTLSYTQVSIEVFWA